MMMCCCVGGSCYDDDDDAYEAPAFLIGSCLARFGSTCTHARTEHTLRSPPSPMRSWISFLALEGLAIICSVLWPWVHSIDVSKYQTKYTRVTNIGNDFNDLEEALRTKLLDTTKALHVTLDANAGSGKWIVPLRYHNGIYIGNSCDISSRSKWLCTRTTELILEGIPHPSKPSPNNLAILSGNDHSRLFWVAGAKLKIGHVVLEKGRSIYGGAALYILSNSIVNLFRVQLLRHTAKYAAAIYMEASGASSIINSTECTFKENLVEGGLQGGAIGIYGAGTNLVTFYNSTFTRNKFYGPGGKGQDIYKKSDSSILYDVVNRYVSKFLGTIEIFVTKDLTDIKN